MVFALDQYPNKVGRVVTEVAIDQAKKLYYAGFHINKIELSLDNHTITVEVFGENEDEERTNSQDIHVRHSG